MSTRWFCKIDGQESGPYSAVQLRQLATQGRLGPSDSVRKESMVDWARAGKVRGLFADSSRANTQNRAEPNWYVRAVDRPLGPLTSEQLIALVQRGLVRREHQVKQCESGDWRSLGDVKRLQRYIPSASNQAPVAGTGDDLIRFNCPHCQHKLKCPRRHAGRTAPCPKCHTKVVIRSKETDDSNSRPVTSNKTVDAPRSPELPHEIATASSRQQSSVPVRNPTPALWQRAGNWASRAAESWKKAEAARSLAKNRRPPRDRIVFYGPGQEVDLGFGALPSPLVYATGKAVADPVDASLVELPRPIASDLADIAEPLPYWPSYREATPAQRACYLRWLAGGRSDPQVEIGYVFIYFYGLERRVLVDRADYKAVIDELVRLLSIYGQSRAFARYAGALLWLSVFLVSRQGLLTPRIIELAVESTPKWTPEALRYCLAYFVQRGLALPTSVAYVVAEQDERTRSSVVVKRHPDRFRRLFEERLADEHPDGILPQPSQRHAKALYQPGSPSLLRAGHLAALADQMVPDALALRSQFKSIVELWSSCIDELRQFDRASRGIDGLEMTSEMYEALPQELRTDDHPEANAWQELIAGRTDESGWPVVSIADLAAIKGLDYRPQLTKKQCLQLLNTADSIGLAIEPDTRLTNKNYRWDETVLVYHDETDEEAGPPDSFLSAAMLLRLGLTIAAADDRLDESELDVITEHLEDRFDLSKSHAKRLDALKHLLITHRGAATTVSPGLKRSLALPERRVIGQFLVSVAAADQYISDSEMEALRRGFKALGLDEAELDGLLLPVRANPPDGDDGMRKESVVPHSKVGHRLNLARIRQIRADTARVQELLHQAMATDELLAETADQVHEEAVLPASSANSMATEPPVAGQVPNNRSVETTVRADTLQGIPARFRSFVAEVIEREVWQAEELQDLARKHGVMLAAAIEAVNEWSQDQFDDWLIEENDDTVRVHVGLLSDK